MLKLCYIEFIYLKFTNEEFLLIGGNMITNNLESILTESNETLYSIAKKTGISYRQLLKINNNKRSNIQTDTIDRILNALNCNIQDLLTYVSDSEYKTMTKKIVAFNYSNTNLLYEMFKENNILMKDLKIPIETAKYYDDNEKIYCRNDSDFDDLELNFNVRVTFFGGNWYLYFNEFDIGSSQELSELSYEELIKQDGLDWLIKNRDGVKTMKKVIRIFENYCKKLQIKGIIIDKINNQVIEPYNQNDELNEYMLQFGFEIASKTKLENGQNFFKCCVRELFFLKEI